MRTFDQMRCAFGQMSNFPNAPDINAESSITRLTPNNFTVSAKCTTVPATLTPADMCILASR